MRYGTIDVGARRKDAAVHCGRSSPGEAVPHWLALPRSGPVRTIRPRSAAVMTHCVPEGGPRDRGECGVGRWSAGHYAGRRRLILWQAGPLAANESLPLPQDATVSPTFVPDMAEVSLGLLIDSEQSRWHPAKAGAVSWSDLLPDVASRVCLDLATVPADSAIASVTTPHRALDS